MEALILLFTFFQFYSVVSLNSKVDSFANPFFFFLIIIRSGLLVEVRGSVCMPKSNRSLCVPFSNTDTGLCIYHLFVWSNLNFLHISQWITLLTQSCLILYSFCANLLHSLIMWFMISSLSLHSPHLLFCCVLSILALIWLVLMALFCAAMRRDYFSLLKFPFLSQVHVFWLSLLLLFTPLEFSTSVLADGFSLEFEWQQVSSSLQDSSKDSGRSQQCCHLDSIYPSANFQVLPAF